VAEKLEVWKRHGGEGVLHPGCTCEGVASANRHGFAEKRGRAPAARAMNRQAAPTDLCRVRAGGADLLWVQEISVATINPDPLSRDQPEGE
jgi:hypothetical protein